jgi:hypothetical protein
MATSPEGIMALGQPTEAGGPPPSTPGFNREDYYNITREALKQSRPDIDQDTEEILSRFREKFGQLSVDVLEALAEAVEEALNRENDYAAFLQEVQEEAPNVLSLFPTEYDEEFLTSLYFIVTDAIQSKKSERGEGTGIAAMAPQQFAQGGIAEAARLVAQQGRRGDTMLAHINPQEARLLKALGGAGTINPRTGLPEYGPKWLRKLGDNTIGKAKEILDDAISDVRSFVREDPLGSIIFQIGLTMVGVPYPIAAGLTTAARGGDLKDIALSTATAWLSTPGGPVSNFVSKYTPNFMNYAAVNAALTSQLVGTGAGLLQGQSLSEAAKNGFREAAVAGIVEFGQKGSAKMAADASAEAMSNSTRNAAEAPAPLKTEQLALKEARLEDISAVNAVAAADQAAMDFNQVAAASDPDLIEAIARGDITPASPDLAPSASGAPGTSDYLVNAQGRAIANAPPLEYTVTGPNAPDVGTYGQPVAPLKLEGISPDPRNAPDVGTYGQPVAPLNIEGKIVGPEVPVVERSNLIDKAGQEDLRIRNAEARAMVPEGGIGNVPPYKKGGPDLIPSMKKAVTPGTMMEGLEDVFAPGPSKEQIFDFAKKNGMSYDEAEKYLSPNFMRTYGPTAAAGVAGLALAGGFGGPEDPDKTQEQQEYEDRMRMSTTEFMAQDPSRYFIQNIPGVKYDERGAVIGTGKYKPAYGVSDITGGSYSPYTQPVKAAYTPSAFMSPYGEQYLNQGGIATLRAGGYPRRTGQISGPGTETSDDIPAMLSDGEFVMTARAVRGMGNGSRREGARKMYALMHKLESNASRG